MGTYPTTPELETDVPVLDLAPLLAGRDTRELAGLLRAACESTAFFYITNHGVPQPVIDEVLNASRRFFEQSPEVRMQSLKDRFHRGYLPIGTTQFPGRGPDLKDSFDIGIDLPLDHPSVVAGLALHGPNQWPALAGFRDAGQRYFDHIRALGMKLLVLFARSLDLDDAFFVRCYEQPTILMRLMHYPPQKAATQDDSIGATAHTDFGVITVLLQDPGGGLEIQREDGRWSSAPQMPGTFVVNLGQLMARWTNDVYRATPHRVVNRLDRDRYSIPFFFNPDHHAQVTCIDTCAGPGRPAKYTPVVAGEHIASLVRRNQDFDPDGGG
ncbi:MAG: isopenicillin N synthase family oxygenase [Chromatiales bacterium]|jgi:isopenicillin N synthase-like dioxygenase|nr:isopenicillin N synthase family oxygenase [Chromatiales bacterium]